MDLRAAGVTDMPKQTGMGRPGWTRRKGRQAGVSSLCLQHGQEDIDTLGKIPWEVACRFHAVTHQLVWLVLVKQGQKKDTAFCHFEKTFHGMERQEDREMEPSLIPITPLCHLPFSFFLLPHSLSYTIKHELCPAYGTFFCAVTFCLSSTNPSSLFCLFPQHSPSHDWEGFSCLLGTPCFLLSPGLLPVPTTSYAALLPKLSLIFQEVLLLVRHEHCCHPLPRAGHWRPSPCHHGFNCFGSSCFPLVVV